MKNGYWAARLRKRNGPRKVTWKKTMMKGNALISPTVLTAEIAS